MPAKVRKDLFSNRSFVSVTMSVANAITYDQIRFGVGLFQGVALVLHKIEWYPRLATVIQIIAETDELRMAITNREDMLDLTPMSQNVLALAEQNSTLQTAVGFALQTRPLFSDFQHLPGGGLIIPANPLFIAADSVGFATPGIVDAIIYYTFRQLSDADYVELIQSLIPANI